MENRGTVDSSDLEREVGGWLEARNWLEDSLFPERCVLLVLIDAGVLVNINTRHIPDLPGCRSATSVW